MGIAPSHAARSERADPVANDAAHTERGQVSFVQVKQCGTLENVLDAHDKAHQAIGRGVTEGEDDYGSSDSDSSDEFSDDLEIFNKRLAQNAGLGNSLKKRWRRTAAVLLCICLVIGLLANLLVVGAEHNEWIVSFFKKPGGDNCKQLNHCCDCNNSTVIVNAQAKLGYDSKPSCGLVGRSLLLSPECGRTARPSDTYDTLFTCTGRSGSLFLTTLLQKLGWSFAHDEGGPSRMGAVAWQQTFAGDHFLFSNHSGKSHACPYNNRWVSNLVLFRNVFHLVRNPLTSIESRWNLGTPTFGGSGFLAVTACNCALWDNQDPADESSFEKFEALLTPEFSNHIKVHEMLVLQATLRHWVLWNMFAQETSSWGVQLEALNTGKGKERFVKELSKRIGQPVPSQSKILGIKRKRSQTTNSEHTLKLKHFKLTWDFLFKLDRKFAIMAQLMSLRYGYATKVRDLLPPLRKYFCQVDKEQKESCNIANPPQPVCYLDPGNNDRWTCGLPSNFI